MVPFLRAFSEGHRNRPKGGDATQLGGVLLATPDGRVAFLHRSRFFGDNPAMPALVDAVVRVAAERGGLT